MLFQKGNRGFWWCTFLSSSYMNSPSIQPEMWYSWQKLATGSSFSTHVHAFSYDQLDWHVKHQIIGYQQTIIHIIHPIVIQGRRLMTAPANHEADMMWALEQQSGAAMWWNKRRMFEHVVNRPQMWMTNDQYGFLIKLMSVLFMKLCLIE